MVQRFSADKTPPANGLLWLAINREPRGRKMIIKLASATLAAACTALAIAPPAVANESSYLEALRNSTVWPNPPQPHNEYYMVSLGRGLCDAMRGGMRSGDVIDRLSNS